MLAMAEETIDGAAQAVMDYRDRLFMRWKRRSQHRAEPPTICEVQGWEKNNSGIIGRKEGLKSHQSRQVTNCA